MNNKINHSTPTVYNQKRYNNNKHVNSSFRKKLPRNSFNNKLLSPKHLNSQRKKKVWANYNGNNHIKNDDLS
jgi:hypothetical protein